MAGMFIVARMLLLQLAIDNQFNIPPRRDLFVYSWDYSSLPLEGAASLVLYCGRAWQTSHMMSGEATAGIGELITHLP